MFVDRHLGKFGTGEASSCIGRPLYVEEIDARKFCGDLEISGSSLKWHLGVLSFDAQTISVSGTPLSVFSRCALTDREVVVFSDPSSGTYTVYEYISTLGSLYHFHAATNVIGDEVFGYACKDDNGDLYLFNGSNGQFTFVGNFGQIVKCLCVVKFDTVSSIYRPYGLILTSNKQLYRVVGSNAATSALIMSNVVGIGDYVVYSQFGDPIVVTEGIITDDDGNVFIYNAGIENGDIAWEDITLYGTVPSGSVLGIAKHNEESIECMCYYDPLTYTLYGQKVIGWQSSGSGNNGYPYIDNAVPIVSDVQAANVSKPYIGAFTAVPYDAVDYYRTYGEPPIELRYLIGAASEVDSYSMQMFDAYLI